MENNKLQYDQKNFKKWLGQDFLSIRDEMVRNNQLWEDPLYPTYELGEEIVWERPKVIVEKPCMYVDKPSRLDVHQGSLGDCTVLASFQQLPMRPELFKHIVPEDQGFDNLYAGVFHFRLWNLGTWVDIVIDDRLPVWRSTKTLAFAYSRNINEKTPFWPMLLEKVISKYYGRYEKMPVDAKDTMRLISGGITEYFHKYKPNDPELNIPMNEILARALEKNTFLCCHTWLDKKDEKEDIINHHAYGITKVFKCGENDPHYPGLFLLRLRNPWGSGEWKGRFSDTSGEWKAFNKQVFDKEIQLNVENDGEFWIEENMFKKYFIGLHACFLGPGQFSFSLAQKNVENWNLSMFLGEWVKGVNDGGKDNTPPNPRYNIYLEQEKNDSNKDNKCSVIISLTQQNKTDKITYFTFGFFIEHGGKRLLDSGFNETGEITLRTALNPGSFDIVPCTWYKEREAKFLLRIYSDSSFVVKDSDDSKISKLPYMDELCSESEMTGKTLLQDHFCEQKEIDWKDLKLILENALNKDESSSSTITKIFTNILRIFWNVLSSLSFGSDMEHSNNEKVELSKNTVRSMIAMSNNNRSDKLDYTEFQTLWNKISLCYQIFKTYSEENQGSINAGNLRNALEAIGCSVNSKVLNTLVHRYCDEQSQISVDDFILCGVTLHTMMNNFEEKVSNGDDKVTVSLDEWVAAALY